MQDLKNIINSGENKELESQNTNNEMSKVGEDMVKVSKVEMEGMLARIKKLEEGGIEKVKRVQENRAYVRLFNGKIIKNIGRMWTEPSMSKLNPEDENRLFGKIITEDDKEHSVDFVHLLEDSERLFGAIKKREQKDATRNLGSTLAEPQDPYSSRLQHKSIEPFEIDMVENKTDDSFVLEIMEGARAGEKIEVHNSVLNL
jgi:hypothetical protein